MHGMTKLICQSGVRGECSGTLSKDSLFESNVDTVQSLKREREMYVSWSGVDKNNTIQVALVGMQSML